MSREIKFSFMWQHQETGRWLDKRYTLDEIIGGDPYDDMSDSPLLRNFVHKYTREYTGLLDKNGKEIYEGDMIRDKHYYKPVVIEWDNNGFWCNESDDTDVQGWILPIAENREIIGNIYENPELLEAP